MNAAVINATDEIKVERNLFKYLITKIITIIVYKFTLVKIKENF